jgi:hypothetical protein
MKTKTKFFQVSKNNQAIAITDLDSLLREKARLRKRCHRMERDLSGRVDHLRTHYGIMAFQSVFPGMGQNRQVWSLATHAVKAAWRNDGIRNVLLSMVLTFLEFLGVRWGTRLISRYLGKNKTRRKPDVGEAG